jgi:hypothetical protein
LGPSGLNLAIAGVVLWDGPSCHLRLTIPKCRAILTATHRCYLLLPASANDRLLLILSEDSISSEWVNTEIAKARKREAKEGKRVLFPVRLVGFETLSDWECFDGDTGKDSAREIREYFIPDFSRWKEHDSYQVAIGRLVGDLKAEASK